MRGTIGRVGSASRGVSERAATFVVNSACREGAVRRRDRGEARITRGVSDDAAGRWSPRRSGSATSTTPSSQASASTCCAELRPPFGSRAQWVRRLLGWEAAASSPAARASVASGGCGAAVTSRAESAVRGSTDEVVLAVPRVRAPPPLLPPHASGPSRLSSRRRNRPASTALADGALSRLGCAVVEALTQAWSLPEDAWSGRLLRVAGVERTLFSYVLRPADGLSTSPTSAFTSPAGRAEFPHRGVRSLT